SVRKPSGISINLSSGCTGVAAGSSKDFAMLTVADEIGTWRVSQCSVFESTSSSCSSGSTVHTATGPAFAVSRASNISFTSGLSFPESVQNNSIITISSTALNPSQADIFARMMCIFMLPGSQQNIVANSSCFAISGEAEVPVGVNLLANKVGQWDLVSCSMLGSLDSACADQTVHATNRTGGTFVSVALPVLNLSIISTSMTFTVITGGDTEISAAAGNANNFAQYANMMCSIRNPGGAEENLTSRCKQVNASGTQTFQIIKTVNELGRWNVTLCRLFASTSANCTGAVLQNSTTMGTFEVVLPTNLIIRNAFGNNVLNSSFTNITAIIENPLSERKYALVACDVTSPAGRNSTHNACTGLETNQVKYLNFTLFVDEVGTWKIPRCSINASNSFDCAASQSHSNATGGTFSVASRTNLTFVNATVSSSSVFIGSAVEVQASVRNPSQTDLFGNVTCSFSTNSGRRQNSSSCTVFRAGTVVMKNVNIVADVLGTWTAGTCVVSGTLDSSCAQSAQHDTINIPTPVNVTTVPDLVITNVEVPEGINRNTTGIANVRVRNDGLSIFAIATCSIRSPNKTMTNSSGCQIIGPGEAPLAVPFFVDRLGNWSVFGCSANGSANSTCVPSRLHNTSNITKDFNATGKVLQIEEILKPESGIKVGDRVEVIVRVKNVDDVLHKGFVNCTLRQPTNQSKEITSSVQAINADETKLFRPSFIAELSGQWRLRTCTVYRTESPIFKEDEKTIEEIFSVSTVSRPPPSPAACTINTECPGTDLKCFCSGGECRACPVGATCRNHVCESIVTPQCTFDSDCPLGFQCESGTCIEKPVQPYCTTNDQCLAGYVCISGQCQQREAPSADQTIINLILIALVAIIIAVGLLFVLKKRLAGHDIYSELGKK
ncbi:MAG: hypothetical protein HY514_02730, partial [Candidatus Aenigmarchaeota archaeon]|nr:hypothetical protein [Candidatus Aenigmarchaeota archaeon]